MKNGERSPDASGYKFFPLPGQEGDQGDRRPPTSL